MALAKYLHTEIVSADSRQIYQGLPITTAAPSDDDLEAVRHHFIATLPLEAYYNAAIYEQQALKVINKIFETRDFAIVCGGSMMYIDALCKGIDQIPDISEQIRNRVKQIFEQEGNAGVIERLQQLDPEYVAQMDQSNPRRAMHALEVCLQSGVTYSSLRTGKRVTRPFEIRKYALTAPRQVIFDRINSRVDKMVKAGMDREVRAVAHMRHLNSLNTVGVKEMLKYIDGEWSLQQAAERLKKNTRVYAKKQLFWLARDTETRMLDITATNPMEVILSDLKPELSTLSID